MRLARRIMILSLLTCLTPRTGLADVDPADYAVKTAVRSEKERKRLAAAFAADRAREAELHRQDQEREQRRLAAEKAAWEALPASVRLMRTRCTACHVADNFVNQQHNRIGWELVILRMQILNDAPLADGERSVIAAQLAETYPATGSAAWAEALQQLAIALFPVWFWLIWKIARSRFAMRH
jgi:hypothetical protein